MMRRAHLRRSLAQFRSNPLRTALALLGMVLGVGSVVGMVSIGEGAQAEILASLESLGGDVIHLRSKDIADSELARVVNESAGLSRSDLAPLREVLPTLENSAWVKWSPIGVNDLPAATFDVEVAAASPSVFAVHRLKVAQGRELFTVDDQFARRVAVLGADLAQGSFGSAEQAVGRRVRVGYAYFDVVGVLSPLKSGGDAPVDPARYNRAVIIPFNTAAEELTPASAYAELDVLSLEVGSLEVTGQAKRLVTPVVRSLHGGLEDVDIVAPEEILASRQATQAILNAVLISIAAISLLVGGIGVMNIMLANIMERISEIGLRRAIGASQRDIRDQFLVESIIVCLIGGGMGLVLGLVTSFGVGSAFGLRAALAWEAMLAAVLLSMGVGLLFGLWPAVRASRISPVEALQHE